MTIEASLKAVLAPLVGGRAYPAKFPQEDGGPDPWPAIRYVFIGTSFDETICGYSPDEESDQRVQVDAVDKTYDGMRTLRAAVLNAMTTMQPPAIAQVAFEDYEPDEKRHRFVAQFVLFPSSV